MGDLSIGTTEKTFKEKYTTQKLLEASPETEKDKIILSNDAYAQTEAMDHVNDSLKSLRLTIGRLR